MDADIDNLVKSCTVCQQSRPAPAVAPSHSWEWPSEPWSRLHLDFMGPFMAHMFLILVDAHSKWIDVHQMQSITSTNTIEKLRVIFATHGLPWKVVTDNRSSFTSKEFRTFTSTNGITHVTTAPYHPSSNGLSRSQRAVQTIKRGLKATKGDSLQEHLSKFLFTYPTHEQPQKNQAKQAASHDNSKPLRSLSVGDFVYTIAKDLSSSPLIWIPGTIVKVTGPLSCHVKLNDGSVIRRHVDAVCTCQPITDSPPLRDSPLSQEALYFLNRIPPTELTSCTSDATFNSIPSYYAYCLFTLSLGGKCGNALPENSFIHHYCAYMLNIPHGFIHFLYLMCMSL